jgi:hypothetical protein
MAYGLMVCSPFVVRELGNFSSFSSLVVKGIRRQVLAPPSFDSIAGICASVIDRNRDALRHSARTRACNASMKASSVGFPGREKSISTPLR